MTVFNNTTKLAVGTVSTFPWHDVDIDGGRDERQHIQLISRIKLAFTPAPGLRLHPAAAQTADSGRGTVPLGRCFVITPERFVIICGSFQDGTDSTASNGGGGFNRFAWCDQENPGAWDYSNVVSQAGFLDVEPSSPIITALCTRTGTLIWTGKKVLSLALPRSALHLQLRGDWGQLRSVVAAERHHDDRDGAVDVGPGVVLLRRHLDSCPWCAWSGHGSRMTLIS